MAMECDGWGLAAMGATAMGCVGSGVSAQWGVTAIEHNGWGLAAMAEMVLAMLAMVPALDGVQWQLCATAGAWRQWPRW